MSVSVCLCAFYSLAPDYCVRRGNTGNSTALEKCQVRITGPTVLFADSFFYINITILEGKSHLDAILLLSKYPGRIWQVSLGRMLMLHRAKVMNIVFIICLPFVSLYC